MSEIENKDEALESKSNDIDAMSQHALKLLSTKEEMVTKSESTDKEDNKDIKLNEDIQKILNNKQDKKDESEDSKAKEKAELSEVEKRLQKQLNDSKSAFHKAQIRNKILAKRVEELFNNDDIDEDIKNKLLADSEENNISHPSDAKVDNWNKLLGEASKDLNKRYEYTKDASIDKHTVSFNHYLNGLPEAKADEIRNVILDIADKDGVEKATSEMLAIGKTFFTGGIQSLYENDFDVNKIVDMHNKAMQEKEASLEKIKKELEFANKELEKLKDIRLTPSKDYSSSGAGSSDSGGSFNAFERAKKS